MTCSRPWLFKLLLGCIHCWIVGLLDVAVILYKRKNLRVCVAKVKMYCTKESIYRHKLSLMRF
jgi:hypothetical protein